MKKPRKARVIPGPWTDTEPKVDVKATLKVNKSVVYCKALGDFLGTYLNDSNWDERGWYPIVFNIMVDNINELIEKHGIDEIMAAIEKSMNSQSVDGKSRFGTLILLEIMSDGALKSDTPFMSLKAKTNKKSIENFRAIRSGKLITL